MKYGLADGISRGMKKGMKREDVHRIEQCDIKMFSTGKKRVTLFNKCSRTADSDYGGCIMFNNYYCLIISDYLINTLVSILITAEVKNSIMSYIKSLFTSTIALIQKLSEMSISDAYLS